MIFGIVGGLYSSGLVTRQGNFGTLNVNSATGVWSYVPDDALMQALSTDAIEIFTVTLSDGTLSTQQKFLVQIAGTNDAPSGAVTVSGVVEQGQALTVTNTLVDLEGISASGSGAITYQWKADGESIHGATGSSLMLTQAMVGKAITVKASYTDLGGNAESVTSAATEAVVNVDDEATGTLNIAGAAEEGGSLTASQGNVLDADGATTTSYRWQELVDTIWTDLSGATASTLAIPSDQSFVGKQVRVVTTTTDALGGTTTFEGAAQSIANVDDEATGTLIVTGATEEGGSLTASLSNASDADGATTIAYRWEELVNAAWTDLSGATAATLAIPGDQSFVGKQVRVVATTTDALGGTTAFESAAQTIANVDDEATGTIHVLGATIIGSLLSATVTNLLDADGPVTSSSWQWQLGSAETGGGTIWTDIPGADESVFAIPTGDGMLGAAIRAVVTTADSTGGSTVLISDQAGPVKGLQANITARFWTGGASIPGTAIQASDGAKQTQTGPDGQGTLQGITSTYLTLSAQKAVTPAEESPAAQAVTLQDAVSILKMIAGQALSAGGPPVSRFQSLAADFDGSGTVSLADALGVLRHAVGLQAPKPAWVFVEEGDDALSSILGPGIPGPVTAEVTPPDAIEVNLIGVLRGDVDGSWDPQRYGVSGEI